MLFQSDIVEVNLSRFWVIWDEDYKSLQVLQVEGAMVNIGSDGICGNGKMIHARFQIDVNIKTTGILQHASVITDKNMEIYLLIVGVKNVHS